MNDGDDDSLLKDGASSPTDEALKGGTGIHVAQESTTATDGNHKRRRLQGWRFGVALSAIVATCVLIANFILALWAYLRFDSDNGIGTAFVGECSIVNTWALWLHILINALSSILLSASNYTMQSLSSPTRKECDAAHARGDWLDIGVAGVRNLSRISWQRRVLWILLGLSSVPIHLLYNSAVFKTLDANQYHVVVANSRFLEGGSFDPLYGNTPPKPTASRPWASVASMTETDIPKVAAVQEAYAANSTQFETLGAGECITTYGKQYVSGHSHVILMTDDDGVRENNTVFYDTNVEPLQTVDPAWW